MVYYGSQKFNVKIERFIGKLSLENAFESGFLQGNTITSLLNVKNAANGWL